MRGKQEEQMQVQIEGKLIEKLLAIMNNLGSHTSHHPVVEN